MATHSNILAWRIPWTEEPGGLLSRGSQRVGCDRVIQTYFFSNCHISNILLILFFFFFFFLIKQHISILFAHHFLFLLGYIALGCLLLGVHPLEVPLVKVW